MRWWQIIPNTPILGEDGHVRWIINRAEDVTELVELRAATAEGGKSGLKRQRMDGLGERRRGEGRMVPAGQRG